MTKKFIYIILILLLTACKDSIDISSGSDYETAMRFEAIVVDKTQSRGQVLDVHDNYITRDFKPGDSFGLFIIDGNDEFVSLIDEANAKNIKLTTPDGTTWNLNSDIKEIVHKLGYRYVAYYPYSEVFNECNRISDIEALLTPPAIDQSAQEATDWMCTDITSPQTNAVTTLKFVHRYAKIEIFNSFTQDHNNDWDTKYLFTKTVDDNNVEHYRYLLDATTPFTLSIKGTYNIGNYLTGIKKFSYHCDDILVENGHHAIVYTYRMDERCAIDLGFPSGIRWSPINLGTETSSYMDEAAITLALNSLGTRLAWGELFEKDTYSSNSYINDPYYETNKSLLPTNIAATVYDPVKQYWGGHWELPNSADLQEFIDNTEILSTETVSCEELGKNVKKITFRSTRNGKTITMLTNGYASNANVSQESYLYYMSSTRPNVHYCTVLNNNPSLKTNNTYRYLGFNIRPVLKEKRSYDEKKYVVVKNIDDYAVDLGITKTVTEIIDGQSKEVTYKVLWSPFNYGAEAKADLPYNLAPIDEAAFMAVCCTKPGMRLAWGDIEERAKFSTPDYVASAITAKYDKTYDSSTGLDRRYLQPEDDIVQVNWPDGWYIPTAQDFQLLVENTSVKDETINGNTWFRLTSTNGNSILIPGTGYIDDSDNVEKWATEAYLQSSTIGVYTSKPTIHALRVAKSGASLANSAGRPTGLMVRPVKYVRVD